MRQEWASFNGGVWQKEINVRDFIQKNYTPYEGDESFLAGPTKATNDLWAQVMELTEEEHKKRRCPGYGYSYYLHHYIPRTGISQ